jgi:hypothetical protein
MTIYSLPVAKLLTLGKPETYDSDAWLDYRSLGLDETHIPGLIRLATDVDLHLTEQDIPAIWGPVHAWRALGQLRAVAAIEPLLPLFESLRENEWLTEELPQVLAMIGPAAIQPLAMYLEQTKHAEWPCIFAAQSLVNMAQLHPEVRTDCVAVLAGQLQHYQDNGSDLNGFLIHNLIDLKASECLPLIREAFEADTVNLDILGDLEDVEIALGAGTERIILEPAFPEPFPLNKATVKKADPKVKAKRKMAKQSRKKNRKKKK